MNDTRRDMISGELYQPFSKELYNDRLYCKSLCHELNNLSPLKRDDINLILDKLLNEWNEAFIEQPFQPVARQLFHIVGKQLKSEQKYAAARKNGDNRINVIHKIF